MKRIPVYKKCSACFGQGEIIVDKFIVNPKGNASMQYKETCKHCKGTGKEETDMFIEDPYCLFDFEGEQL